MQSKKIIFYFLALFSICTPLLQAEEDAVLPLDNLEAKSRQNQNYNNHAQKSNSECRNTLLPYFTRTSKVQSKRASFVQANVGIGFLYFSGIRGNLATNSTGTSALSSTILGAKTTEAIQGRLNYNRTPLYEVVLGYQWNNVIKTGLSFQSQTNVTVFTNMQQTPIVFQGAGDTNLLEGQLFSDLNLYAVAFKSYFTFPFSLVVKMVSFTPYLSAGIGPCWQTWKRISLPLSTDQSAHVSEINFNQKISANAFFTMDLGFSTTWLIKNKCIKIVKGTRFNIWGQARSMGKREDQTFGNNLTFLLNPVRIKTVYQFAPYIGLSFDF